MRIIKKYDNRCLYDSVLSANIILADLKQYVLDGVEFKVINAKNEEDLTRQYLMQIILELEAMGNPLFSERSLEQIIRFYSSPQLSWFQSSIEQALNLMAQQQQAWQKMWDVTPKPKDSSTA